MNLSLLFLALSRQRIETERQGVWDTELYDLEQNIRHVLAQNRGASFRVELIPVDTQPMTDTVVTFAEAARRLHVARSTIHRRVEKGSLLTASQGGRRGIPLSALELE